QSVDQLRHWHPAAWRHHHRRQPPGRIHRIYDTATARPAGCRAGRRGGSIGLSETLPAHPDVEIVDATKAFERFLRVDVFRFRHRLFSGEWSALRSYDALRRSQAASIVLYDPDRENVVLVEQFRLPALLAGSSPWQLETAASHRQRRDAHGGRNPRNPGGNRARANRRADPDAALSALARRLRRKRFPVLRPRRREG